MNAPPFLIGAAVLFWAWQAGLWAFGIPIALVLEAARWVPWRLHLAPKEFRRIWDVCGIGLLITGLYLYNSEEEAVAVLSTIQWLPIFVFPLIAAERYAVKPCINATTFFWLMRRYAPANVAESHIDVSYGYLAVCLLAASAANVREAGFYAGACALIGIAIWANRSRRLPAPFVAALFAIAVLAGIGLSSWMRTLQADFEQRTARWLAAFAARDAAEQEGFTRLGEMGPAKLSGRVVLRIEGEIPNRPPELLRQLTFSRYESGAWFASRREYQAVSEDGMAAWTLVSGKNVRRTAIVSLLTQNRRALLP